MVDDVIVLNQVGFSYNEKRSVLKNLNLTIPKGKVVALMGGSGSGKTTVLRLMAALLSADSGSVVLSGCDARDMSARMLRNFRSQCGFMFQHGALFTDMSVFENVAFPLREHASHLPEEMIRSLVLMKLHAVGLRAAHVLMPSQLSGGMARRVALARAIALDPSLIFYDEPFTGLDPVSLGVTARLIRKLNDVLGATSIVVSHDVHETFTIADYVYFLSQGEVVVSGSPEELIRMNHPYVRQFVDATEEGPVPFHMTSQRSYAQDLELV